MADMTNDKKKQQGAPTAGNRDSNDHSKMPEGKPTVGNDQLDVDVGNEKTATRPPQQGPGKPGVNRP